MAADTRPVRWSVKTHQRGWSYDDTSLLWRQAEAMGFFAAYLNDHMYGSALETWSLLGSLFSQTTRIRGGTMVTSAILRNPAVLARMATTVDIVSKGRLILGLGAGNEVEDYPAYGMRFPPPRERAERLDEACRVLTLAWTGDVVDFAGEHYRLEQAQFLPTPVQRPHPYLILGAKGDRTMATAVRFADEWNWNRAQAGTEEFLNRMDRLDELCERAGRDPHSLPRSVGHRRLLTQLESGRENFADAVRITRRCIDRGASQIVLMLDRPGELQRELDFYRDSFIPAVLESRTATLEQTT